MVTSDLFDLSGRVALVTGGGSGLGLAMARALASHGARVYINGRNAGALGEACARASDQGTTLLAAPFDVSDEAAAAAALSRIAEEEGRLDILVNNVGKRHRADIDAIGTDVFMDMLQTNVVAAYSLACIAARHMAANSYGRIIMLSSNIAGRGRAGDVAYISGKGAIESLTRSLACEWGDRGILTNAISPGPFATAPNIDLLSDPATQEIFDRRSPLRRWGEPHEIGAACVFLASPGASYVNGEVLTVDGGMSIQM